jgi:hypothetical protein
MSVPAHDGHDSEPMADIVPTAWRTVFRRPEKQRSTELHGETEAELPRRNLGREMTHVVELGRDHAYDANPEVQRKRGGRHAEILDIGERAAVDRLADQRARRACSSSSAIHCARVFALAPATLPSTVARTGAIPTNARILRSSDFKLCAR